MTVWTAKAERGSEWLIRLIAWLARVGGRAVCRSLLFPITLYFVLTDRTARHASLEFHERAGGQPVGWLRVFQHIYTFATSLLDRVYLAAGEFRRLDIDIVGLEHVDQALAKGRGCVVLGSHLGSFDLLACAQRRVDKRPISIMMRVDPRARLRRIAGIGDEQPAVIQTGRPDSFIRAYRALERGEIVAMLADRNDGSGQVLHSMFLERMASFPVAPHVLAARSGAATVLCFGLYIGGNKYRIEFVDFSPIGAPNARGSAFQEVVDRYAGILEAYARKYPLNWFNFYPFWYVEQKHAIEPSQP